MRMEFDINEYQGKFAMHCKTEDEAKVFCKYLHDIGKRWNNGDSFLDKTYFFDHQENTCYAFGINKYSNLSTLLGQDYTILEFSDFIWKGYRRRPEFRVFKTDMAVIDDFLSGFQVSV